MVRALALPAWAPPMVAVALASAAAHLWGERRGARAVVYVAKPLTTALLAALALALPARDPGYRAAVAIGLAASLAGDVWLMLPGDRFVPGLASFLVAHAAYLVAFTRAAPFLGAPAALALYALVGAALVAVLWPRLGTLRAPVLLYAAALVAMAAQAAAHAGVVGTLPARLAAVGAALFVASDAILAVNRFRAPVPHAQEWIMTTYVAAQLCIALSVAPGAARDGARSGRDGPVARGVSPRVAPPDRARATGPSPCAATPRRRRSPATEPACAEPPRSPSRSSPSPPATRLATRGARRVPRRRPPRRRRPRTWSGHARCRRRRSPLAR